MNVPLFTNHYKPGSDIRFYRLPLKKPKLLKIWMQRIRCESIPVKECTRVCSAHFSGSPKRLGPNDIPSIFVWSKPTTPRPKREINSSSIWWRRDWVSRYHRGKKHIPFKCHVECHHKFFGFGEGFTFLQILTCCWDKFMWTSAPLWWFYFV